MWAPIKKDDICSLESIQRSFTARINCLKCVTYWDPLKEIMSVQRCRARYLILHMMKIFTRNPHSPNDIGVVINWNVRTGVCRVTQLRSKSMYANTLRYHSFASIGPRLFNALPRFIESSSLDSFKAVLDEFLTLSLLQVTSQLIINNYTIVCWTG